MGEHGENFGIDVEETGECPVCGFAGAYAADCAGGGIGLELEIDDDGEVVWVCVGPVLQVGEAVDKGVANRVWVEVCDVEDFDAGLL